MRDLDQLREREEGSTLQRHGLFLLAGGVAIAAMVALVLILRGGEPAEDPLAPLAASARAEGPARSAPAVELSRLSFPATLSGDESAVEATVKAAAAEHAALTGGADQSRSPRARAGTAPVNTLATEEAARLARDAKHDPLIAGALPERGEGVPAPAGSEGPFTLQVVSYESREAAERFVDALRLRGHKAYIGQAEVPGRTRYFRVRIGPFTTRREAVEYQKRFEQTERMHTLVVTAPRR